MVDEETQYPFILTLMGSVTQGTVDHGKVFPESPGGSYSDDRYRNFGAILKKQDYPLEYIEGWPENCLI